MAPRCSVDLQLLLPRYSKEGGKFTEQAYLVGFVIDHKLCRDPAGTLWELRRLDMYP